MKNLNFSFVRPSAHPVSRELALITRSSSPSLSLQSNGRFAVDNVSFVPPTVPALLQILSGAQSAQDLLPAGSYIPLPPNSVIEFSMPGGVVGGGHPIHLHGVRTLHQCRLCLVGRSLWIVRFSTTSGSFAVQEARRTITMTLFCGTSSTLGALAIT